MGKTRVHLLAKELGIETKDLIAQLDKLGLRGRKAQSALEDDEVARVRAALTSQEKPQVHVGEEKVVSDRLVKTEDDTRAASEARETVVERRVRANVIRRRVSRVAVPQVEPPEGIESPVQRSAASEGLSEEEAAIAAVALPEPATSAPSVPDVEFAEEAGAAPEAPVEPAHTEGPQTTPPSTPPAPPQTEPRPAAASGVEATRVQAEAPKGGARILGRIDLKQTLRVEPAPTPVLRKPLPGAPGAKPADAGVRPADGATGVRLDAGVDLVFAVAVDRAVVEADLHLFSEPGMADSLCPHEGMMPHGGMPEAMMDAGRMQHMTEFHALSGGLTWSDGGRRCTFQPDAMLAPRTRHMIHLGPAAMDMMERQMGGMTMNGHGSGGMARHMMFHFTTMDTTYFTGYPSIDEPYTDPVPNWGNTKYMFVKIKPKKA